MDNLTRLMAKVSLSISAFSEQLLSQGKEVPLKLLCIKAGLQEFARDKGLEVTYCTMMLCGQVEQCRWTEEEKETWNQMKEEIEDLGRKSILDYAKTFDTEDSDPHP